MPETPPPDDPQPLHASARALLRSTVLAAVTAVVVLVTVVWPLAYGFDPTGIGRVFGFTDHGREKMALAREELADALEEKGSPAPPIGAATPEASPMDSTVSSGVDTSPVEASDLTTIALQPGEGKEVKLVMVSGARARYSWSTDGPGVNFLTHGDTANAPANAYHTYSRGSDARADSGLIEAVFDGNHGWFWRNRTRSPVIVTLHTNGYYQEIRRP